MPGDGDPTFGDPVLAAAGGKTIYHVLDDWAGILKARGVTSVDGQLALDDDIFQERRHPHWPQAQHQRWFCAPVSGLNFNDNCLDIRIRLVQGAPQVEVSPAARSLRFRRMPIHGLAPCSVSESRTWDRSKARTPCEPM